MSEKPPLAPAPAPASPINARSAIRVSEDEMDRIIAALDAASETNSSVTNQRSAERKSVPKDLTVVYRSATSEDNKSFLVRCRNLSDTGIGFLHGGFLHLNRECVIDIFNGTDCLASLQGVVVRCRHIAGMIHEAGVVFDRRINAHDILQKKPLAEETPDAQPESLPRLQGQVLYLDHIEADRRYTCLRMTQMGVSYVLAHNINTAMDILESGGIDIVLSELRLRPDPAQYLIRRIRQSKLKTPIIVTAHSIGRETMKELKDLGAQACLTKPYRPDQLAEMLKHYLKAVPEEELSKKKGMPSVYWSDPACRPLIVEYISDLKYSVEQLTDLKLDETDLEKLTEQIKQMSATASLYGYPKISESTKELEMMIGMGAAMQDAVLEQLISMDAMVASALEAIR